MSTELSTELVTHKLEIKGEPTRYITKKQAEYIFTQLTDKEKTQVEIISKETLTYLTPYKRDVKLIQLWAEDKTFEDKLILSWLWNTDKERVREIWNLRKKEGKAQTDWVLQNIIDSFR